MHLAHYKRIILHVGLHKTGTSFLQQLMKENEGPLRDASIHYPPYITPNAETHGGNHSFAVVNYRPGKDVNAHLSHYLDLESTYDTLLLSAEEFSRRTGSSDIVSAIHAAAPAAKFLIIVYLRRPDHLIESVYAESVKRSLQGDISKAAFQLDFRKTLNPLVGIFGKSSIKVRPYNRQLWPNRDLAADFFTSIGHPHVTEKLNTDITVNQSFTRTHTYLLSTLSSLKAKNALIKRFEDNPLTEIDDIGQFFRSPEERRRMIASHRSILADISSFFSLGDADLFFGTENFEEDAWMPFAPNHEQLLEYMCGFADELANM